LGWLASIVRQGTVPEFVTRMAMDQPSLSSPESATGVASTSDDIQMRTARASIIPALPGDIASWGWDQAWQAGLAAISVVTVVSFQARVRRRREESGRGRTQSISFRSAPGSRFGSVLRFISRRILKLLGGGSQLSVATVPPGIDDIRCPDAQGTSFPEGVAARRRLMNEPTRKIR
jgi:hypothetical protein